MANQLLCMLTVSLGTLGLSACMGVAEEAPAATSVADQQAVAVSGRQILVDGAPYLIRGVCYNPVPKGAAFRDFTPLAQDLKLMVDAGVNTIRVYAPIDDKAVLDQIHAAGLKLIVGFGYNQNGNFDILSGSFIDYINTYKDHPVILMWELGNEYNYHPEWFEGDITNWYAALNNAAGLARQHDPSHPVATAHGELPDELARSSCPNVAVWGMNVYRWDEPGSIFSEWEDVSDKPMYLSEAGADRYMTEERDGYAQGENEKAQARATEKILEDVFSHREICSGVTLYAFCDEWWKAGNPDVHDTGGSAPNSGGVPYDGTANEEYWGIVDIDRNKTRAFNVVKEIYSKH